MWRPFAGLAHPAAYAVRGYRKTLSHVPIPRGEYFTMVPGQSAHRAADSPGTLTTATDFLTTLGRDLHTKVPVENWNDLFRMERQHFKKLGVGVQDRKSVILVECLIVSMTLMCFFSF